MKIREAAELLRRHPNTLRNYLERYPDYFSPQPDKGKQRNLTDNDVRVIALIARLSDSGLDQIAIADALEQKVTAGSPFPPVAVPPPEADSQALVPVVEMERRIAEARAEIRELQGRLEEMRRQLERQEEIHRQQLDRHTESYRVRETELVETINKLNREIGRLQARLEVDDESD